MKTLATLLILLCFTASGYTQNKCIPNLLSSEKRNYTIYIEDPCIDDTLRISLRTRITFQDSTLFSNPIVKTVNIIDLELTPKHTNKRVFLDGSKKSTSPFYQYIWDLCFAKFSYWYKEQHYAGWLNQDLLAFDCKLYMIAVFYIIPSRH